MTSRLGTGKSVTFFYSVAAKTGFSKLQEKTLLYCHPVKVPDSCLYLGFLCSRRGGFSLPSLGPGISFCLEGNLILLTGPWQSILAEYTNSPLLPPPLNTPLKGSTRPLSVQEYLKKAGKLTAYNSQVTRFTLWTTVRYLVSNRADQCLFTF